jgi:hypothetical protein
MLFTEFNMDEAKRVWREEALFEGMAQNAKKNALAALAKGLSVSDVADITGLDEETVMKLKMDPLM